MTQTRIGPQGRFEGAPLHLQAINAYPAIKTPDIIGVRENWCLPLATHRAETLADVALPPVDHHTLIYHRGGAPAELLLARGERLSAKSNSVSLMSADVDTVWHSEAGLCFTHVYLRREFLRELALETDDIECDGMLAFDGLTLCDPELPAKVRGYVRAVERGTASTLEIESRAVMIGMALLRGYAGLGEKARRLYRGISPLPNWRLRKLADFVEAHLDQPLRLADLAQTAGQSPHHLIRTMRAATGLSPYQWLTHKRIERARELLARTDLPLIQVALECGFGTQQHFTTVFRQGTGMTPGAFRRSACR